MDVESSIPLTLVKEKEDPDEASTPAARPSAPQRQSWGHTLDFLVSLVGSAVGLGNVWRFPFLCYRNGGGTFLLPYFLCLLLLAIPQQLLEVTLGQLMARGAIGVWGLCPLLRGVGVYQVTLVAVSCPAYLTVIAWALYYTCSSFVSPLPWAGCDNAWNTPNCTTNVSAGNASVGVTSTTEFWEHKALGLSDGVGEAGAFQWQLYLCCVLLWALIFVSLCRGVSLSGKVMYPMTLVPYVLLFSLLGYSATMPGSRLGLSYLLTPQWSRLGDLQVWADAGRQVFYSLSVGLGVTIGISSHNRYRRRSYIDCLATAGVNTATSFLAGFVIFMTLGYMSVDAGVPIERVADDGVGLAFVTYPLVLMRMPLAQLWSVVFFLMITMLGLSSILMSVEGLFSAASDIFPVLGVKGSRQRAWATLVFCVVCCTFNGLLVLGNGMYSVLLVEFFNGSKGFFLIAIFTYVGVMYVFGGRRFTAAVQRMYRIRVSKVLLVLWGGVAPLILAFLFVSGVIAYTSLSFRRGSTGQVYRFPGWAVGLGWCLEVGEMAIVPGYAAYLLLKGSGSFLDRLRQAVRPQLTEEQRERLYGDRRLSKEEVSGV